MGFDAMHWDSEHKDLTFFNKDGEPFGYQEFQIGSLTRNHMFTLHHALSWIKINSFYFALDSNVLLKINKRGLLNG